MKILVNGKEAVLKAGSSFEYVSENPLFTEAEDYSLEIEFPLKDCPENILIFGALHVKGVDISTVTYPCEIKTETFHRKGILTITGITDVEVKGQFLEGISENNFYADLSGTYITDLDYSAWDGTSGGWENFPDGDYDKGRTAGWIEFPVYDTRTQTIIEKVNQGDGRDYYSRHIYMWKLVDLIAAASGWTVNQNVLKAVPMYMHMVVANVRGFIYNDSGESIRPLGLSLPHWTIREFLNEIGKFFGVLVSVDSRSHNITFRSFKSVTSGSSVVDLEVLDDFEIEVNSGEEPKYRGSKLYKLPDDADPDHINSCSFIFDDPRFPHTEMTKADFLALLSSHASHSNNQRSTGQRWLYHLTDIDKWAIITETDDRVKRQWVLVGENPSRHWEEIGVDYPTILFQSAEILNQHGDTPDGDELGICPCPLEGPFVDFVWSYSISHDGQGNTISTDVMRRKKCPAVKTPDYDPDDCYDTDVPEYGDDVINAISSGERDPKNMYYDKLFVVLWQDRTDVAGGPMVWNTRKLEPIYERKVAEAWGNGWHQFQDESGNTIYGEFAFAFESYLWDMCPYEAALKVVSELPKVNEEILYRYKFLSSSLPSAKSIFRIKSRLFVCAKLTTHFTTKGMSELIEGEFYEIVG